MKNNSNDLDMEIVKQMFIPYEAQQILNIPILDKTQDDTITWDGNPDGNYTVKNGYQAIIEWNNNASRDPSGAPSNSGTSNTIWEAMWQYNVPAKHNYLIWCILHDALPVRSNLVKRGIRIDPLCPWCNSHVETTSHVS
jgi:hypothetical protein